MVRFMEKSISTCINSQYYILRNLEFNVITKNIEDLTVKLFAVLISAVISI